MKKKADLLERDIEQYLVRQVAKMDGKAYKWSSPGNRAVADRLCFFPKGNLVIVECKAPSKKPTPLQFKVLKSLNVLGYNVVVIDTKEKVDTLCQVMKEELQNEK
jgi:hypothetical protein